MFEVLVYVEVQDKVMTSPDLEKGAVEVSDTRVISVQY